MICDGMSACYGCAAPDKPVENLWKTTEPSEIQFYTADAVAGENSLGWARYNHRNVKNYVNNDRKWVERSQGITP